MTTGASLFGTVHEYASLGAHRTGTEVDAATLDWFHARLEVLGAAVERQPFRFHRYAAGWQVDVDGETVPSIPLFYEGTGRVRTSRVETAALPVMRGARLPGVDRVAAAARGRDAPVAVVATTTDAEAARRAGYADPGGLLYAVNRFADRPGGGLPVLCVPGRLADRLAAARVDVDLDASIVAGESANVIGRLGDGPDDRRILLGTPLSGWFGCAGERGTGVAVCLAVAEALSAEHPVLVVGTSGHELNGLGLDRYLEANVLEARGIFHFGASVASGNADARTAPDRRSPGVIVQGWVGSERADALRAALEPLGNARFPDGLPDPTVPADRNGWIGESSVWARHGRPLVSIAGGFPLHHAPEDVPELATTPALLAQAYEAALAAARLLA